MPNTLREFLLNGVISCNIEISPDFLKKFKINVTIPDITKFLPKDGLQIYNSFGI